MGHRTSQRVEHSRFHSRHATGPRGHTRIPNHGEYWTLRALVKIRRGPGLARAALPLVQNCLADKNQQNQLAAVAAVWSLNPSGPPPVDALENTFHSQAHFMIRRTVAELLGDLGPAAKAAIPTLTEAAKMPDELMREDARAALQQVEAN